jgi:hypothetical protein
MRHDLALNVKLGDTVYNCCMDALIVTGIDYVIYFVPIRFHTIEKNSSNLYLSSTAYNIQNLYLADLEGETDDEKSWVNWAKDNKDFLLTFDHLETVKEIYKTAFLNGFNHKQVTSFEELMQK